MQADKWSELLGADIPNLLKASMDLEAKITPMLAQIQLNRSSIDESLLKQLDATMEQIKEAKAKICQSK